MIQYVLDNLNYTKEDKLFIIYNKSLDGQNFSSFINKVYPFINLIKLENDTSGAAETLYIGTTYILENNLSIRKKCLILDCDTFYTEDIVGMFRKETKNAVFYTEKENELPIYSYIQLDENSNIVHIAEKIKISNNANTGCYAFQDISKLQIYCKYVLDEKIVFNNECYTSCAIYEMISKKEPFVGIKLNGDNVFSLGTPKELRNYVDNTYMFLFDLDGTLVNTDDIYFEVWFEILNKYSITLTPDIFKMYIQGNNDKYVAASLIPSINIDLKLLLLDPQALLFIL
jgi:hypothetical protein